VGTAALGCPVEQSSTARHALLISDDSLPPEGSSTTRKIDLATAISEIKQAREETEDGNSPLFVIAGAGILRAISGC
jgi:hypothetical protein